MGFVASVSEHAIEIAMADDLSGRRQVDRVHAMEVNRVEVLE